MSCPSSIWHRDSNPRPLECESPPITTRPGLPPRVGIVCTYLINLHHSYLRNVPVVIKCRYIDSSITSNLYIKIQLQNSKPSSAVRQKEFYKIGPRIPIYRVATTGMSNLALRNCLGRRNKNKKTSCKYKDIFTRS